MVWKAIAIDAVGCQLSKQYIELTALLEFCDLLHALQVQSTSLNGLHLSN